MAEYAQWNSIPSEENKENGNKIEYLKLKGGNVYQIRPVLDYIFMYKYFYANKGYTRIAICGDPLTCPVKDKHPDLESAKKRYAAFVIDRADGKIKVMEGGVTIFREIGSRVEINGKDPGDLTDGSDWRIKVSGEGKKTDYQVSFVEDTPLTKEERSMLKEALDGDKKMLKKIYKADTPEKIEEKLFGEWSKKENKSENKSDDNSYASDNFSSNENSNENKDADDFDQSW
jgi:hypothetical protein